MARPDAKTLKARKQRKMAIGLGVLLLAMMAISIPKTLGLMKQLNGAPPATAAAPAAGEPTPVTPGAAPVDAAVGADAAALASAAAPTLKEVTAPAPEEGQLVSFGRFTSKDPFVQQVGAAPAPGAAQPKGATKPAVELEVVPKKKAPPLTLPPVPAPGGTTPLPTTPVQPTTPQPPAVLTAATISVNGGLEELVRPDGKFPTLDPIFTLVSVSKAGAKIAIVDGSYESGAETILLTVGKPLTLMNTADGTRYEILLVSLS